MVRIVLNITVRILAIAFLCSFPRSGEPSELECRPLPWLNGAQIGSDRNGNVWAADPRARSVELFDVAGRSLLRQEMPAFRSVDVDREWGVAALDSHGVALTASRLDGSTSSFPLGTEMADIAWISRDEVAVSPTRAAHLVEIWDLETGRATGRFGEVDEIRPEPGVTFLRSTQLRYSAEESRLYALDSLTGALQAFSLRGEPLLAAEVPAHRLPELEEWRVGLEAEARQRGEIQTPLYTVLRLAEGPQGGVWIVEQCTPDRKGVRIVEILPDQRSRALSWSLSEAACSLNFSVLDGSLLFIRRQSSEKRTSGALVCQPLSRAM